MNSLLYYTSGFIFSKAATYILLPVYTKCLSVELYGKYELLNIYFSLILPLGLMGLDAVTLRFYDHDDAAFNQKLNNIIIKYLLISAFIYFISTVLIYCFYPDIYNNTIVISLVFFLRLIMEGIRILNTNRLRMEDRPRKYFFLELTGGVLSVLITISLLYFFSDKFLAVFLGVIFSALPGSIAYLCSLPGNTKTQFKRIDVEFERELFRYSIPIMFTGIIEWIYNLSDRVILNYYLGYQQVGIYSIGFKLGAIVQILTLGFIMIWPAVAMKNFKKNNSQQSNKFILEFMFYILSFISIILIIIIYSLTDYVFGKAYAGSIFVSPWIIFSYILLCIDSISSVGLFYHKKSNIILYTTIAAAAVNVILNILFVKSYGYIFMAISTLVSTLVLIILRAAGSYRYYKMKFSGKFLLLAALYLIFISLSGFCDNKTYVIICYSLLAVYIVHFVVSVLLKEKKEVDALKIMIKNIFSVRPEIGKN